MRRVLKCFGRATLNRTLLYLWAIFPMVRCGRSTRSVTQQVSMGKIHD